MPDASNPCGPAHEGEIRPDAAAEADEQARADDLSPARTRPFARRTAVARQKTRRAAASAFQKRKRLILNLLRAVRSGRLTASVQLGAWGAALLAARLIADSPDGLALTPEGRAMLKEMSKKHAASAEAPAPAGPDPSSDRIIARRR